MEGTNIKFFFGVYDWIMVLQLLTVSIALILVFRRQRLQMKKILKNLFHVVIIFAIGTILNWALFTLSEDVAFFRGINFPLAWLITIVFYVGFFSNIPSTNRIIMGATLYVSVITMTELGHYSVMVLGKYFPNTLSTYSLYYLEDVLIILFAVVLKRYSLSKYTDIPMISAILIMANTTVMTIVVFVNTKYMMSNIDTQKEMYCVTLLAEYILVITGYMMIWFHCKVRSEMTELEVSNRLLESDRNALMVSEKAIEEMRCLRHDIQNQYMIMKMLIDAGNYEELIEYFYSMNPNTIIGKGIKFIDCGNELINSIINMEMMKASSSGVDFTSKISVSDDIAIEKSDLCRILVNLIDNAIEAVERNNAHDKSVDCKISKTNGYLYICVRNGLGTAAGQKIDFNTSKGDSSKHGYGHRIVNKLVNKYQGHIKYSIENDEFVVEAMLGSVAVTED